MQLHNWCMSSPRLRTMPSATVKYCTKSCYDQSCLWLITNEFMTVAVPLCKFPENYMLGSPPASTTRVQFNSSRCVSCPSSLPFSPFCLPPLYAQCPPHSPQFMFALFLLPLIRCTQPGPLWSNCWLCKTFLSSCLMKDHVWLILSVVRRKWWQSVGAVGIGATEYRW